MWSNEKIIAASTSFTTVADEVWRLQRGKDAECTHFQAMADQGHYKAKGGTRQGIYVLTANGTLLASVNSLDADTVLKTMNEGLAAFEKTTAAERVLPADGKLPGKRWESSFPEDGLVLRSLNVDLGPNADTSRRNRDHMWLSAEEAQGLVPESTDFWYDHYVSKTIVNRLVGFHLVDNVRGQTLPFAPADVVDAEVTTSLIEQSDDMITFRISGTTTAKTDGTWTLGENDWTPKEKYPRSVTAVIKGTGRYDAKLKRFHDIEIVVVGTRTGRTNLNGRAKDDVGPAGIGWYFKQVGGAASERMPPAFIDIYGADWIIDPR